MQRTLSHSSREIYSVHQLTRNIKNLLEDNFSLVWISGEISNLRIPGSGHAYFSLKDDKAQISTVMFKGQLRQLKFKLADGAKIVGMGRITVYEPRGNYQIILEYVEPHGVGALQIAYEQLKQKLENEGLFDPSYKKNLPFLPKKIGVITSPTGAVVKDILRVVHRRFPKLAVDIFPVRVQGGEATDEIVKAIEIANNLNGCDVIILARGGGSFEDMSAFNSEPVARAVFGSRLPTVSAIGHETDYSITDFVADLRAPTPSAAAEMVVPVVNDIGARCRELYQRSCRSILNAIALERDRLSRADRSLYQIVKTVQEQQLRLDDASERLSRAASYYIERKLSQNESLKNKLLYNNPERYILLHKSKLELLKQRLTQQVSKQIEQCKGRFNTVQSTLGALNPTAILQRGYSITRTLPQKMIVTDTNQVHIDDLLDIQVANGSIEVLVKRKKSKEA